MDRSVRLGLAAQRRVFELLREVAGNNLDVGRDLFETLRDRSAVRLDQGAFLEFDDREARQCVREFIGDRRPEFILSQDSVPSEAEGLLRLWDSVDLCMPLKLEWRQRPEWLEHLLLRGLIRDGARGLRMTARLRLHLWLTDGQSSIEWPSSSPVWQVLRALRKEGRWHEAALWASALADSQPPLLEKHPSVAVTIILGLVQSQNFTWLDEWFARLESDPQLETVFSRKKWNARMGAIRAFSDIERGNPKPPGYHREARFWYSLVRCWWNLYAGKYRRSLRMLEFLQRTRLPRYAWVDPVLASWKATVYHYLEQYSDSREWNRHAMQLAQEVNWHERRMTLMRNLAASLFEGGETSRSVAILNGLERRHMLDHRISLLPGVFNLLAHVTDIRVRLGQGAWTNRRAQHFGARAGSALQSLAFSQGQAIRAMRSSERDLAEALFARVEELAAAAGHHLVRANATWNLARLLWCRGDHAGGMEMLDRAERHFIGMSQHTRAADMQCDRAVEMLELGELDEAEVQIDRANTVYASYGWPREAALIEPLRLELVMRRRPEAVTEALLDGLRSSYQDTRTRTAYAYAIVALGFALLDDQLTSMTYGRDTLAEVNRLQDPFMVRHILNLGQDLIRHSRTVEDVVSFWSGTFPFQES